MVLDDTEVKRILLSWFKNNRRTFIWRQTSDPFTILIAEILLKKTQAIAIEKYLPSFLARYHGTHDLIDSPVKSIANTLAPLGLSQQRAKQLKALAEAISNDYRGSIPKDKEELLKLPGIGPYTAGAILSFAYGMPEPIVDTNIARIITRYYGIMPSHGEARRSPEIWVKAKEMIGTDGKIAQNINWALLDLGAMVCKNTKPIHEKCPLLESCTFVN